MAKAERRGRENRKKKKERVAHTKSVSRPGTEEGKRREGFWKGARKARERKREKRPERSYSSRRDACLAIGLK